MSRLARGWWRGDGPDRDEGRPLDPLRRQRAEAATGRRLDDVRLHDDPAAHRWVDGLGAMGASVGRDVALGTGAGNGLLREAVLAHELAHAAAQAEDADARPGAVTIGTDRAAEQQANRSAAAILLGGRETGRREPRSLALHRCVGEAPPKVKSAAAKTDPAKLAAFDKLVKGGVPAADAAAEVQLPKELTDAMEEAWKGSFPGGKSKEQGGVLVRKSDGTLDWIKASKSTSGTITMPFDALPSGSTPLVAGHTHPYDVSEGGHKGVAFSGADLANLVTDPSPVKVVHAGDRYFMVSKTKEFEDAVAAKSGADKTAYKAQIKADWASAFGASKGDIVAAAREATIAVCKKHTLVLHEGGTDGQLTKVDLT